MFSIRFLVHAIISRVVCSPLQSLLQILQHQQNRPFGTLIPDISFPNSQICPRQIPLIKLIMTFHSLSCWYTFYFLSGYQTVYSYCGSNYALQLNLQVSVPDPKIPKCNYIQTECLQRGDQVTMRWIVMVGLIPILLMPLKEETLQTH